MARKEGDQSSQSAVSRRDFLKYGAAAGAVVSVLPLGLGRFEPAVASSQAAEAASVGGLTQRVPPQAADQGQFLRNGAGKFKIAIQDCPVASANIESIQIEDLTIDVRETTTGADWDYRVYGPGDAHYGKATFRSRVGKNSKELLQWLQDASVGKNVRKNISVIIKDRQGAEARRWNLIECFPIKYDPGDYSPSSTTSVETITVKIGRVEFA